MKTRPPVKVGKTSAGKPVKKFRCGKCKKLFPKGQGHNARTCGKNTQRGSGGVRPAINVSPHTPPGGANRVPSISEVDTLLQQKLKKGETVSRKPQRTVDKDGTVRWTLDGELHREDGPAVEYAGGNKWWYRHGKLHREDGPAEEYADGTKFWWVNDKLHRLDGPAVEWPNGQKEWWVNDKQHRLDGPAEEWLDGTKLWWVNGVQAENPEVCEKAISSYLTDEEFYKLCTHEDYVVRQLAAHNPKCPAEWRTLVDIMDG